MSFNFCSSHHDGVIKYTIYDIRYTTRRPAWSNFKNKHDEVFLKIQMTHISSNVILAWTLRMFTTPKIADISSFHQFQSFIASGQLVLL